MNLGIKDRLRQVAAKAGFKDHEHVSKDEQIETLKYKLEKAEKLIAKMRINFTKEIINM